MKPFAPSPTVPGQAEANWDIWRLTQYRTTGVERNKTNSTPWKLLLRNSRDLRGRNTRMSSATQSYRPPIAMLPPRRRLAPDREIDVPAALRSTAARPAQSGAGHVLLVPRGRNTYRNPKLLRRAANTSASFVISCLFAVRQCPVHFFSVSSSQPSLNVSLWKLIQPLTIERAIRSMKVLCAEPGYRRQHRRCSDCMLISWIAMPSQCRLCEILDGGFYLCATT